MSEMVSFKKMIEIATVTRKEFFAIAVARLASVSFTALKKKIIAALPIKHVKRMYGRNSIEGNFTSLKIRVEIITRIKEKKYLTLNALNGLSFSNAFLSKMIAEPQENTTASA